MTITSANVLAMYRGRQRRGRIHDGIRYAEGEWSRMWLEALARHWARWTEEHGMRFAGWAGG